MQSGLAEFLIRSVLEPGFRELALNDPAQAFEGFDLTSNEKDILSSGDERVIGLLGQVFQNSWPAPPATRKPPAETASISSQTLPDVTLRLRLVPYAVESPDSNLQFRYAASLHPWTDDSGSADHATDDASASAATAPGAVDLMIRIVPTVISLPGSEPKVAYAASIQAPETPTSAATPPEQESSSTTATSSRYYGNSMAARQAAAAVRQAEPSQRYQKILDLVHALRNGDDDA